ncbi:hypothetical protein GUJ93_ZPchr0008g12700 [Zizania palustris]|uniref:Uncharacterized protein n=1 Tax=Zizania palustris TaxID=103762 RepID=A0A8J5V4N9_ZIZPA|nr:hypothetical protein GUJ93_ZPchr0008g12700 [Zizania palustris]
MQAVAVSFGQAGFVARPLRRTWSPRPYHLAWVEGGVAAGRGCASLPRLWSSCCAASLSVGSGGYGGGKDGEILATAVDAVVVCAIATCKTVLFWIPCIDRLSDDTLLTLEATRTL